MLDIHHFLFPCRKNLYHSTAVENPVISSFINLNLRENASLLSLSHLHKKTFQSSITFENKFMWHLNEVMTEARYW